jgi:DNA polymerase III epsilon subunit family exonuclease
MVRNKALKEIIFCAFDVETSGVSSFSRMCELGAVRFRIGEKGERFSTLVNPEQPISQEVIAIHGISDEMVKGAPRSREALIAFLEFSSNSVLLAHNAGFDVGVVSLELAKSGVPAPENLILDTLSIARSFLRGRSNYRLQTLIDELGLDSMGLHRALPDALAAKGIFERIVLSFDGWETLPLRSLLTKNSTYKFSDFVIRDVEIPAKFETIKRAIEFGWKLTIIYEGGTKGLAPRVIKPIAFYQVKGTSYLAAISEEDDIVKSYRLDRIREIET